MPDYDPQSIPILDDVIVSDAREKSSTEDTQAAAESFIADTEEAETNATENNIDLFFSQEESQISSIEHITDTDPDESFAEESVDASPSNPASPADDTSAPDTPALETSESLESIVNDVVKHLMPDLEQQLRYLVQQALEERLPQEIMQSVTAAKEKNDDS